MILGVIWICRHYPSQVSSRNSHYQPCYHCRGAPTSYPACSDHRDKVSHDTPCIHGPYQPCAVNGPVATIGLKPGYIENVFLLHVRAHNLSNVTAQRTDKSLLCRNYLPIKHCSYVP